MTSPHPNLTPTAPPGAGLPTRLMLPAADRGGRLGAVLAWLIILGVAGILIAMNASSGQAKTPAAPAQEVIHPPGMLAAFARAATAAKDPGERRQMLDTARSLATTPMDKARVAVLTAEVLGRAEGLRALDQIIEGLPADSPVHADALILRRLVDGQQPASLEPPGEMDKLRARQGFFKDLAVVIGRPDTDPQRRDLLESARQTLSRMLVATVGLIAVLLVAGVMFIVGVARVAARRIVPRLSPPGLGGSVYLEAFAVFLASFLVFRFVAGALADAGLGWAVWPLQWLLLLCALWPVVRGTPWREHRRSIGWHTGTGVAGELLAGLGGYLACLPIVALGVGITLALNFFLGGQGEPLPTHPLGDRIATGGSGQLVLAFILATLWAPIVEESLFRGALYRHLRARWGVVLSALLNGVIFAAIHPQGWMAIPPLTALAVTFSLLREWRGSLIAPMTAHALNNGLIVLVMVLITGE